MNDHVTEDNRRYSVGTWCCDLQAYTPQEGLSVPAFNIDLASVRQAIRELRKHGYSAHRRRDKDGDYDDNDTYVVIERTDGKTEDEIMEWWKR